MNSFGKFHFQGQKEGEVILLVLHRHWFDILTQMLLVLAMIIILILSAVYLPILFPNIVLLSGGNLFIFFEVSWAMFTWILFFILWIDYYFDVWIVTNKRVVNIDQKGLFVRNVSELELENIQDITTEVRGVIPTFFNYGDVFIQTAAEKERFIFHSVPNPYGVKDLIMNLQEKMEHQEDVEFTELLHKKIHHNDAT
jgi:hypothetical protein